MATSDLISSALTAAQQHADRYGVAIPMLLISPSRSEETAPVVAVAPQVDTPPDPVPIPPPNGIRLDGPNDMPDRLVARARHPKGKGRAKIRHEVPGFNIKEFSFHYKDKQLTLTLADVRTPQGIKTAAYIGKGYVCDFAQTNRGAACILRHSGRGKRVETTEPIPAEYRPYYCVDYRTVTGYTGSGVPDSVWCVVVPPDDAASIAAVAIRRWLAAR